jgi:hypothetical protein
MSNLCHCATVNQTLKWRKKILEGKDKYYPKELIPAVARMGLDSKTKIAHHYEKRRQDYLQQENITEFVRE